MPKRKGSRARKHRTLVKTATGQRRLLKRDAKGRIVDNQSARRASQLDQKKRSRAERGLGRRGECGE